MNTKVVMIPDLNGGNAMRVPLGGDYGKEFRMEEKDALIGYMAVMISIAIENMRSNSFDESALEALKRAQAAYFSHVTTPKITKI